MLSINLFFNGFVIFIVFTTVLLLFCFVFQKKVFEDVGRGILDNAWRGFNCSLFAYGQTGSGKSWSIIGYGANKGVSVFLSVFLCLSVCLSVFFSPSVYVYVSVFCMSVICPSSDMEQINFVRLSVFYMSVCLFLSFYLCLCMCSLSIIEY